MAKEKFDYSLLTPEDEAAENEQESQPKAKAKFDPSKLVPEKNGQLGDVFKKLARQKAKDYLSQTFGSIGDIFGAKKPLAAAGEAAIPAEEQIPTGIKEGLQKAYAGLTGGQFHPSEVPEEYGAGFGRGLGEMLGQGAVAAPIAAGAAGLGATVGIPAALGGIVGAGLGYGATTPGNALERLIEGTKAAAIPGGLLGLKFAGKTIGKGIKKAWETPKLSKEAKQLQQQADALGEAVESKGAKVSESTKAHEATTEAHEAATEQYNQVKDLLEQEPALATGNPNALTRKSREATNQANLFRNDLEAPPPEGAPENIPTMAQAETDLSTAQRQQKVALKAKSEYLEPGREHGVPVAEHVVETVKNRKKEIGEIYNKVESDLKDEHVLIPRTKQISDAEAEIRKTLSESRGHFKNDEEFEKTVGKLLKAEGKESTRTGNDIVPASDILSNYRTARNLAQKMRTKAYSSEVAGNKDLQSQILTQASELEASANNLEKILEENDLGTSLEQLKKANTRWRTEITPLYENSTYQTFLNKGYAAKGDLITALRGNKPGQKIIRDIIQENPEINRRMIAQRYAEKPENLAKYHELSEPYIAKDERLSGLRNDYINATENVEKAEQGLSNAKRAEPARKAVTEHEQHIKETNAKIAKLESSAEKLANAAKRSRTYLDKVNQARKAKNITLKEKIARESAYKKAESEHKAAIKAHQQAEAMYKKAKSERNKLLVKGGGIAATLVGGNYARKKLGL